MYFVDKGIEMQEGARNAWQAKKLMETSCHHCVIKNKPLECETCPIWYAHQTVLKKFEERNRKLK